MANEITIVNSEITEQSIKDYLLGSGTKLTDEQFKMFLGTARACNLSPFKREIYAIPFEKSYKDERGNWLKKTEMTVVTGYQTYIERATASGLLDGWKVDIVPTGAKITLYRKDFKYPFEWEVFTDEIQKTDRDGKPMGSWKTMKNFMIRKVAIAQGFRLCFPNELGSLPYLQEELSDSQENIPQIKQEETKEKVKTVGVSKVVKKPEVVVAEVEIDENQVTVEGYIEEVKEVQIPKIEEKMENKTPSRDNEEKLFSFETILVGINAGDSYILNYISENFFRYGKGTQSLINEHLIKNKRNPVIAKEVIEEEVEDISKNTIIQVAKEVKEEINIEEIGELFDIKPEITLSTILGQCLVFGQKMNYTHSPEVIMNSLMGKEFPGRTTKDLKQEEIEALSERLQRKIDSI